MSEFDDNEIGSLDCDEIEGYMDPNSELLKQFALEFNEQRKGDVRKQKIFFIKQILSLIKSVKFMNVFYRMSAYLK